MIFFLTEKSSLVPPKTRAGDYHSGSGQFSRLYHIHNRSFLGKMHFSHSTMAEDQSAIQGSSFPLINRIPITPITPTISPSAVWKKPFPFFTGPIVLDFGEVLSVQTSTTSSFSSTSSASSATLLAIPSTISLSIYFQFPPQILTLNFTKPKDATRIMTSIQSVSSKFSSSKSESANPPCAIALK